MCFKIWTSSKHLQRIHNEGPTLREWRNSMLTNPLNLQLSDRSSYATSEGPIREHGQDLWTISERSRGELQLFTSRPEGCEDRKAAKIRVCTAQDIHSLQHCKSHGALNKKAGSGVAAASVRGRVFPLLRQTHPMLPRLRPGPLDHVQRSHVGLQF